MPSSAEYQDAAAHMGTFAHIMAESGDAAAAAYYTLALRCLHMGAAIEAGKIATVKVHPREVDPRLRYEVMTETRDGFKFTFAPDPLTAAERAMGVGT